MFFIGRVFPAVNLKKLKDNTMNFKQVSKRASSKYAFRRANMLMRIVMISDSHTSTVRLRCIMSGLMRCC
jgi:hypothetical protein